MRLTAGLGSKPGCVDTVVVVVETGDTDSGGMLLRDGVRDRNWSILTDRFASLTDKVLPQVGEPVAGALVTTGVESGELGQRAKEPKFLICQG